MSINMRRAAITGAFVALLGFAGAGYAYAQSSETTPSTTTPDNNGSSDNSGGRHDGNCPHMGDSGGPNGASASGASTGV
jgi:hypothetical protein